MPRILPAFVLIAATAAPLSAGQQRPTASANGGIPPGANTADRSAPFHVDLTALDLRTNPPTRDPRNPAYPTATALPDGVLPPPGANGNFILGPTHAPAAETLARPDVAHGHTVSFTLSSADSVIYGRGVVRDETTFDSSTYSAATAAGDPSNLIVTASRPGSWTRIVRVYVPASYVPGTPAPFIVVGDGEFGGGGLTTVLDNLIAARRLPPIVAIFVGSGGQDAQGSERGREYDTVSGTYAQWLESEVLPVAERTAGIRLTRDPNGRAMMGISSSGVAAFTAAWFRPDLYRRVLAYSPTFVNQQWPHDPALPGGAWEYHSPWTGRARPTLAAKGFAPLARSALASTPPLLSSSPRKPIRVWFAVGDRDLFYPVASMADGMHDWVLANEAMARTLAGRGYRYQFVFARGAGHVDARVMAQTLPAALEWLWAGYPGPVE